MSMVNVNLKGPHYDHSFFLYANNSSKIKRNISCCSVVMKGYVSEYPSVTFTAKARY